VRPFAAYLRSLNPRLPRSVWLLQAGGLANMFGNGAVVPFLIIYLHNVRGISLGAAGLIAATNALVALFSGPAAGALADRIGARQTLIAALLVMSGAFSLFPLIENAWQAFLLNALAGLGSGAFWPSQGALLSSLTPPARRHAAFGQQRVTMNLGIGLGGLAGGLIASTEHPSSFTTLFLIDALTFLVFAAILTRVPNPTREPDLVAQSHEVRTGYGRVLRDRPFVAFLALNTVFIAASIALFSEFFPVFAKKEAGVTESGIGVIFFINTLVIVVAQLPITKFQEGRRRMAAFSLMGVLWAASWLLVWAGGLRLDATAATALFAFAFTVFAIGECLHGTVQGPLVSDLAPPSLIGRYMALSASSWQIAFIVSPAAGGFILQAQPFALWPIAAGVCLAGAAAALVLERRIPAGFRRTPVGEEPERVAPVEVAA
jgi:MFS family permease